MGDLFSFYNHNLIMLKGVMVLDFLKTFVNIQIKLNANKIDKYTFLLKKQEVHLLRAYSDKH